MPKLTSKDFENELQKEGTPTNEETLINELWNQKDGVGDSLQVLGLVDEPFMDIYYDDDNLDTEDVTMGHRYHMAVLDKTNNQKYILHIGAKEDFDGYSYEALKIEKFDKEMEYTHKPVTETMIHGLSIDPNTLSYTQKKYFHASSDTDYKDTPDEHVIINAVDYNVYLEKHREIHNNVFSCEPYYGTGCIHKGIFELRPEMKEKLALQEQKVRDKILFYPQEQEKKEQELEIRRESYRALARLEATQKKKAQQQTEKEVKLYEQSRVNRQQTTLDKSVKRKNQKNNEINR